MGENIIVDTKKQKNGFLLFLNKLWSAKITFGITFAITTIAVAIVLSAVVNPTRATYQVEAVYTFPGAKTGRYNDGTIYNYLNNVSYDNLKEAKEASVEFSAIDIDAMSKRSDISVAMVEETVGDSKEVTTTPSHLIYTVPQKYFANYAQARSFLDILTDIPIQKALSIVENEKFNYALLSSASAVSYDSQLNYLNTQYSLINNGYASLIANYGTGLTYISEEGETLLVSDSQIAFHNYFVNHSINSLQQVLQTNGYVKSTDTDAKIDIEARIAEIDKIIERNTVEIDSLTDIYKDIYKEGTSMDSPFSTRIQELVTQNTTLTIEKDYLQKKLDRISRELTDEEKAQQATFEGLIATTTTKLTSFVEEYTLIRRQVDSKEVLVSYVNSSHVVASGALAWYTCAIVGIVAGLILAVFVAYFKGTYNYEKTAEKSE